jgi:hypothetical protein
MAYREFTDDAGTTWRAWDTYPGSAANVRPGYEGGWLGFESEGERRRLAPVPAAWADASDDELRAMLASAHPSRPARATIDALVAAEAPPADADAGDGVSRSRAVLERVKNVLSAVDRTLRR